MQIIQKIFDLFRLQILTFLPKNLLSRAVGKLAQMSLPKPLLNLWIKIFIRCYKIDMSESVEQSFENFNQFFTRSLRPECRPIAPENNLLVSPVDCTIGMFGKIDHNTILQAKGIPYALENLVIRPEYAQRFRDGDYITLYLSPRNYHRIHSPVQGTIEELFYIPGTLYPVNNFAVKHIPCLFTLNERLITLLQDDRAGKIAVIKVGATIVGKIKVVYDTVESNKGRSIVHKTYERIPVAKGAELGRFQLGSTVILLFEPGKIDFLQLESGQELRFGQAIAKYHDE